MNLQRGKGVMLKGKVIVVTGGAGLIGSAFTKAIVEKNGIAIIADNDVDKGKRLAIELSNELMSNDVHFVEIDVTSKESINKCIMNINNKYRKIDALVNNSYPRNKNYGRGFFEIEYDDFVENLGMNLGGCVVTSQLFSLFFRKQGCGNIINISSIYGAIAPKFEIYNNTEMTMPVEYAAIKSSMIHLTKYMAKYFKDDNIRVNAISPGGIFDSQPEEFIQRYNEKCLSKGMLNGVDICGTLIFLLSDMSLYINGQNIIVDDGFSI
jgi:NAD(P)-dependent dehydrogenase (short-subunit alcohol dehydrogenase family)